MSSNVLIMVVLTLISLVLSVASFYIIPIAQIGIFLYGMPALFLVGFEKHNIRRWAYILGCLSQPFWFITTISHSQWGILILCFFYSGSWANGTYRHWIK